MRDNLRMEFSRLDGPGTCNSGTRIRTYEVNPWPPTTLLPPWRSWPTSAWN